MITVDDKEVLRRKALVDGLSIRQVARQNGCSRATIKRATADRGLVTAAVVRMLPPVPGELLCLSGH
jgi:hypothetical protein